MIKTLIISALLMSTVAESRAGGGRSMGVSRPSSYRSSPPARSQPPPRPAPPAPKPKRTYDSSDVVGAAAAGAAATYLLTRPSTARAEDDQDVLPPCRHGYERERYDGHGVCVVD